MNDAALNIEIPSVIGTTTEHGVYFGRIRAAGAIHALFQPSAAVAHIAPTVWNEDRKCLDDAFSFSDGYANTVAMAKAGSKIAQRALDCGMHIASLDESDLQYRTFKPTTTPNDCWLRAGINLNAETPLEPYVPELPAQTTLEAFRAGGPEAFPNDWLWTSTQYRGLSGYAWAQYFGYGTQYDYLKTNEFAVRLVRRVTIR